MKRIHYTHLLPFLLVIIGVVHAQLFKLFINLGIHIGDQIYHTGI